MEVAGGAGDTCRCWERGDAVFDSRNDVASMDEGEDKEKELLERVVMDKD